MKQMGILAFILIYLVNCNFLSNSSNKDKSRNLFKLLAAYFYLNSSTTTGLKLTSPAVKYNILPFSFTCDGLDSTGFRGGITPSLSISNVPSGTNYFAITMHTTKGTSDNLEYESLWVLYDISVANTSLASVDANIAPAGTLGISQDWAQVYFPPCSSQPILNTYVITVYALPKALGLSGSTTTYSILTAAASEAKLESTTLSLTNIRYNPDATTDLQVPTSVPTTCVTKSVSFSN